MISDSEQSADTAALVKFLKRNLRVLLLFTISGATIFFVVSFFLPKLYKSTGIVYPPSSPSVESIIDNPNFGFDIEADRLIQILQSNAVRDSVTSRFKLTDYYELDMSDPEQADKLTKKFNQDVQFQRTGSMSILISARTKDPQMSADIVNYIISLANRVREKIYKQNIYLAYDNTKAEYEEHKNNSDSLQAILASSLQENNLNSLLLLASNSQLSIDLDKLSGSQKTSSPKIASHIIAFKNVYERMREAEGRLLRLKKILRTPVPRLFVIDYALPRYKKISPSFLTNAVVGGLVALIMAFILLLFRNSVREP